ncbi:hypothetical protein EDB84DRAFT_736049 [Lactarius hengduanensis]|nr:hypothetical protein EDB84DRAFT_736049 [Lactarius hengduanensis]
MPIFMVVSLWLFPSLLKRKFFFRTDLYGTEDLGPDPTIKPEPQDNSLTVEPVSSLPTAEPDVKPGSATLSKVTALTSSAPIASWSEPASNIQRHVPPPAPNVPQQIPTYQESNNDDRSPGRGNYHNVAVEERSVRPSEMKDEGLRLALSSN